MATQGLQAFGKDVFHRLDSIQERRQCGLTGRVETFDILRDEEGQRFRQEYEPNIGEIYDPVGYSIAAHRRIIRVDKRAQDGVDPLQGKST